VTRAVDELLDAGMTMRGRADTLVILDPAGTATRAAAPAQPLVALAMPRYARSVACADAAHAYYFATKRGVSRMLLRKATSLGIRCFNMLLADALNARREYPITHFAMIHDDQAADEGWLDVLMDELDATGADMVSAVVPIKNQHGLTSTAVDVEGAPWIVRRLTMTEVFDLPETFGIEDIPWRLPHSQLLVNSGLWVMRLDTWADDIFPRDNPTGAARPARLHFNDHARLVQLPNGEYASEDISEDWDWSRQIVALGLRPVATRKVKLYHERPEFHNHAPWGDWKRDEGHFQCLERLKAIEPAAEMALA
jgi:hypothetical protein